MERFFGTRPGTFVEVGGYDGLFASNTWGLAVRGWNGHLVEPVPDLAEQCRLNYRNFPNVRIHQTAIGAPEETQVTLYIADTLTTANPELLKSYAQIDWAAGSLSGKRLDVPTQTLNEFLESTGGVPGFELLVVDVEGYEEPVFAGLDLKYWQPAMIIVELAEMHPDLWQVAAGDARLGRWIASEGYSVVFKDKVNTIFVNHSSFDEVFK